MKALTCVIGFHAWHAVTLEGQIKAIVCMRCGKQEIPDPNVAVRLGSDDRLAA